MQDTSEKASERKYGSIRMSETLLYSYLPANDTDETASLICGMSETKAHPGRPNSITHMLIFGLLQQKVKTHQLSNRDMTFTSCVL